jgi:hypothetical protein
VPLIAVEVSVPVETPPCFKVNPVTLEAGRTGGEPVSVKLMVSVVPAESIFAEETTGGVISPPTNKAYGLL